MDVAEIRRLGRGVKRYLAEFTDCFGRCDTESYLGVYVAGQTSDLQRKSAEPMALRSGIPPRSLQAFLGLLNWDEERLVDRLQEIVVRDHHHEHAIGLVDETGIPKKGRHTAGVQRQWCGNTGKVDNCVVSVHMGYSVGGFHTLLDSELYLPKSWAEDTTRRHEARIPDEVVYRPKWQIALDQIKRALGNGVRVAAWTFDEHYGGSYGFLDALDVLGQTYVAEVPRNFHGWAVSPKILYRATPQETRRKGKTGCKGKTRRFPRLASTAPKTSEVLDLLKHSPAFTEQEWVPIHIKDGEKGPMIREVKSVTFRMQRNGLPTRPHWLLVTRDPQQVEQVKFFVSNANPGCPVEWLAYVGYSRWPIEQCFKEEKDELGFDHFEVRSWRAIRRHMVLTQVSHLYLNKMRLELIAEERRQEEAGVFFPANGGRRTPNLSRTKPDRQSTSRRNVRVVPGGAVRVGDPQTYAGGSRTTDQLYPTPKRQGQSQPSKNNHQETAKHGYQNQTNTNLR